MVVGSQAELSEKKNKKKKQYNDINNAKPTVNKPDLQFKKSNKTNSTMFKCIKYIQYSISV